MPAILKRLCRFLGHLFIQQGGFTSLQLVIGAVSSLAVAGTVTATVVDTGDGLTEEVDNQITESLKNITGTYMVRSSIYGQAAEEGSNGKLGQLVFTVGIVAGGGSADFTPPSPSADNTGRAAAGSLNTIVISYTDSNQHVDDLYWTATPIGQNNGDNILDEHEMFQITLGGSLTPGQKGGNLVDALAAPVTGNTVFTIEMGSSQGAVLAFDRRAPSYFKKVTNFH